eukprot:7718565-Pyramimonas_sp.AAC.1
MPHVEAVSALRRPYRTPGRHPSDASRPQDRQGAHGPAEAPFPEALEPSRHRTPERSRASGSEMTRPPPLSAAVGFHIGAGFLARWAFLPPLSMLAKSLFFHPVLASSWDWFFTSSHFLFHHSLKGQRLSTLHADGRAGF